MRTTMIVSVFRLPCPSRVSTATIRKFSGSPAAGARRCRGPRPGRCCRYLTRKHAGDRAAQQAEDDDDRPDDQQQALAATTAVRLRGGLVVGASSSRRTWRGPSPRPPYGVADHDPARIAPAQRVVGPAPRRRSARRVRPRIAGSLVETGARRRRARRRPRTGRPVSAPRARTPCVGPADADPDRVATGGAPPPGHDAGTVERGSPAPLPRRAPLPGAAPLPRGRRGPGRAVRADPPGPPPAAGHDRSAASPLRDPLRAPLPEPLRTPLRRTRRERRRSAARPRPLPVGPVAARGPSCRAETAWGRVRPVTRPDGSTGGVAPPRVVVGARARSPRLIAARVPGVSRHSGRRYWPARGPGEVARPGSAAAGLSTLRRERRRRGPARWSSGVVADDRRRPPSGIARRRRSSAPGAAGRRRELVERRRLLVHGREVHAGDHRDLARRERAVLLQDHAARDVARHPLARRQAPRSGTGRSCSRGARRRRRAPPWRTPTSRRPP